MFPVTDFSQKEKNPGAKMFGDALNSIVSNRRCNKRSKIISKIEGKENDDAFTDFENRNTQLILSNEKAFPIPFLKETNEVFVSSRKGEMCRHTLLISEELPPATQKAASKHTLRLSDVFPSESQKVPPKHWLLLSDVLPAPPKHHDFDAFSPPLFKVNHSKSAASARRSEVFIRSPEKFSSQGYCNFPSDYVVPDRCSCSPELIKSTVSFFDTVSKSSDSCRSSSDTDGNDSGFEGMSCRKSSSSTSSETEKDFFISESSSSASFTNNDNTQVVPSYLVNPSPTDLFGKTSSIESLSVLQFIPDDDVETEMNHSFPSDIKLSEEKENLPSYFEQKIEASNSYSSYSEKLPQYRLECLFSSKEPGFIDSHCHLDLVLRRKKFSGSFSEFRKKFSSEFPPNYEGCIAIFCYPDTFHKKYLWSKHLADTDVWTSFGCHPKRADDYSDEVEHALSEALSYSKVRALGEIGLDYSNGQTCRVHIQQSVFRRQLQIAVKRNLPLVIHCREAHEDCFHMMKLYVPRDHKIHMHCFKASWMWAEKWLNEFPNLCIGITSCVTFAGAKTVHDVARNIPLNRLLLETDAPYFVPNAISKENSYTHPGMASHVAAQIAVLKRVPLSQVLYQTLQNTRKLYNL